MSSRRLKNKSLVSVRHLSVTYFSGRSNEVRALKDISLEINDGEFIIFFGPSGCGKSTLLYSIAGLERSIGGEIIVQGGNIAKHSDREIEAYHQSVVGMIFQSFYLIPSLSVLRNVMLPRTIVGARKSESTKAAAKLLEHFGVAPQAKKLPSELSGGQQQRVAICRALINDPLILMADEPVGNLDSKSADDVMKLLRSLNDDEGKTILLVTHDPSHLHHAHRIYYLNDGVITAVKVNTEEERKESLITTAERHFSRGLEHWKRTLAGASDESDVGVHAVLKTHELLTEFFTGYTAGEMSRLEAAVQRCMADGGTRARKKLKDLLLRSVDDGGFAMAPRKADRLAAAIDRAVRRIRALRAMTSRKMTAAALGWTQAQAIRKFVLEELGITMHHSQQRLLVDRAIHDRLQKAGSFKALLTSLDVDPPEGAGLDRRVARKIARRTEAMIRAGTAKKLHAAFDEDDTPLAILDSTHTPAVSSPTS